MFPASSYFFSNFFNKCILTLSRLTARSRDSAENSIRFYLEEIQKQALNGSTRATKNRALVVDGKTLTFILDLR